MADEFWMQNPVARSFFITDKFNSSRPYGNGKHEGIDLAATDNAGKPVAVLAAQRGVVTKTTSIPTGYGTYVIVRHDWPDGNSYVTWYGHMSRIDVQQGDVVNAGTTAWNCWLNRKFHWHSFAPYFAVFGAWLEWVCGS